MDFSSLICCLQIFSNMVLLNMHVTIIVAGIVLFKKQFKDFFFDLKTESWLLNSDSLFLPKGKMHAHHRHTKKRTGNKNLKLPDPQQDAEIHSKTSA